MNALPEEEHRERENSRSTNEDKKPKRHQTEMEAIDNDLLLATLSIVTEVIEQQASWNDNAHGCSAERTRQSKHIIEDRNGRAENKA